MNTQKLISLSFLIFSLTVFHLIAQAKYVPPPKQEKAGDYSKSTGVRTGSTLTEQEFPLTLLAPQTYVGQTISTTPSFVWVVGDKTINYEIDFRLFELDEQGNIKPIGTPLKLNNQGGINKLSFPINQPPLSIGKKYLWQVAIQKNNGDWMIQKAEFRVVAIPINLSSKLALLTKETDIAELYAENGFWYDALSKSLKSAKQGELNTQSANFLRSLAESDEEIGNPIITRQVNYLIQIAEKYVTSQ